MSDVWTQPAQGTDYQRTLYSQQEAVYQSVKHEPLGKSFSRGHKLPAKCSASGFLYGKGSKSEGKKGDSDIAGLAAKRLLYPSTNEPEEQFHEQYIRSHGSFGPGEQRVRGYGAHVKPGHRFGVGVGSKIALNGASHGVAGAMKSAPLEEHRITSKRVEDFKSMAAHLGRAQNLGHGHRLRLDHTHAYGKKSLRTGEDWDAKACMQGSYERDEQGPDPDLGTTHTPGFRNQTTLTRAFGVPTVRSDLVAYGRKSIADNQNYGDDVNAEFLLYPGPFSAMGVEDDDFSKARGFPELAAMFASVDPSLTQEMLENAWAQARNDRGTASLSDFQIALFAGQ